ncbi:MAG: DNA alkylation repair protein [Chloroflexota bacterium]
MTHPYNEPLLALFDDNQNPDDAKSMTQYMRNQFAHFGIKSPLRKELLKAFTAGHGLPPVEQIEAIALDLWSQPQRECQHAAMWFLEKRRKKLPPATIDLIEKLIVTKSWWDTIDFLSSHDAAYFFKQFPETKETHLTHWRRSENFWLRRASILFQLLYRQETDGDLLFAIIRENLGSKEFFINKAIGWALRTYSRVDETAVIQFVQSTPLHPLSKREALKWLKSNEKI